MEQTGKQNKDSKPMSQFKNLVFEGGGVKGIAYSGALQVLEQQNIMSDIKRVAGTSAGAITAALVALGANGKDVAEIVGRHQIPGIHG
jgi:NTE family protein